MKKFKSILSGIFVGMLYILAFAYIGYLCGSLVSKEEGNRFFVIYILFLISFYIAYLIQIILHEAGHLLGGILSKYEYVSFRIGSMIWVKEEGKLVRKKMTVAGTGGQCLMCPPDLSDEEIPYKLYHLSGGLANVVLGLIGLIISLILPESLLSVLVFRIFGITGLLLGITNLFPCKMGGMQNDGYNLWDIGRNPDARTSINLVLRINALLTNADSYDELPQKLIDKLLSTDFSNMDLENSVIANAFLYQAAILYAREEYDKAYELYKILAHKENVLQLIKNEAKCECLFYEIISGADSDIIDRHYEDKNFAKYLKMSNGYPSRQRLLYAYYKLHKKDEAKAQKAFECLIKLKDTFAVKADALLEYAVAVKIKNNELGIKAFETSELSEISDASETLETSEISETSKTSKTSMNAEE